jgi:hypothetical protein
MSDDKCALCGYDWSNHISEAELTELNAENARLKKEADESFDVAESTMVNLCAMLGLDYTLSSRMDVYQSIALLIEKVDALAEAGNGLYRHTTHTYSCYRMNPADDEDKKAFDSYCFCGTSEARNNWQAALSAYREENDE